MAKRAMALIFVLILSLNTWTGAAIVSDNDGSSFVTKAEFEAMKKSFAQQVTDYENSITNKIDGAIASYLAGIKVSKTVESSLLLTADDGYWFYGNRPEQTYKVPGIDYILSMHGAGHDSTYFNQWPSAYGCTLIAKSTPVAMTKNIVTLADGKEQYYKDYTRNKWLWNGVNDTWKEKIIYGKQVYNTYKDPAYAGSIVGMDVYRAYDFDITDGYHADISNLWKTCVDNYLQYYSSQPSRSNFTGTAKNGFLDWSANYDSTKTTKKVVCSVTSTNWNAVCNSLTNTWNTDDEQTLKGDAIETAATSTYDGSLWKSGHAFIATIGTQYTGTTADPINFTIEKHCNVGSLTGAVYSSDTDGTASDAKIPSVCSLGWITSENLYLFTTQKTFDVGTLENIKLTDGIPLFYAEDGDSIEWSVKVDSVTGETGSGVSSTDEVDIALGYGKFDSAGFANSNGYVDSTDTTRKTSTISWFTTSSQKKKIKFTMDADSWIYLKVKPHSLTQAQAEELRVWTVNLSNSGTYGKVAITAAD